MPGSIASSFTSFTSGQSGASGLLNKLKKFELKSKFYEKLEDFHQRVLLYKEPGFVVYRAKCVYSGGIVVLKGYSRQALNIQTKQRIWSEVTTLQNAHCPFILKCFDSFEDQGWWFLVVENCAAGDLYRIMQAQQGLITEGWLVSQVLLPLLQTLTYLHNEGIIHRDVKPEHILFNSEKVAKLSGFFLAQDVSKFGYPKDMVGNLDYVAPEVFKLSTPEHKVLAKQGLAQSTYDFKVDVWMAGILIYDVLVGMPPFNDPSPNVTVQKVLLEDPVFPDDISDGAADFILCCLTKDPAMRPTARQLLSHPWIREHAMWTPSEDFIDPVPDLDYAYYEPDEKLGGMAITADPEDEEEEDDEFTAPKKVWYNPMTWFRRRQRPDMDLDADDTLDETTAAQNQSALDLAQKFLGDGRVSMDMEAASRKQSIARVESLKLGGNSGRRLQKDDDSGGNLSSKRSNKVAPMDSPRHGADGIGTQVVAEEEDDDGSDLVSTPGHPGGGGLKSSTSGCHPAAPLHDMTPRSDMTVDDGEPPAPVAQRIQEAAQIRGMVPRIPSAVPPVSISSLAPAATPVEPPHAPVTTATAPASDTLGVGSFRGTQPVQLSQAPPPSGTSDEPGPQDPPPQTARSGAGNTARPSVPMLPLPTLSQAPHPPQATSNRSHHSTDQVLQLSARSETNSALYSGRHVEPPSNTLPASPAPPNRQVTTSASSKKFNARLSNGIAELAPPGYDCVTPMQAPPALDAEESLSVLPPPPPGLTTQAPATLHRGPIPDPTYTPPAAPGTSGEATVTAARPGSSALDVRNNMIKSPTGVLLAMETGPTVLSRPGSRLQQSRPGATAPGDLQPVPPPPPPV